MAIHHYPDHLPIFCSLPLKFSEKTDLPKFVWKECTNASSLSNLQTDLEQINWSHILSTDQTNNADSKYNCFLDHIIKLKNKHMPLKKLRFNRYKDKINPWITNGILNSIKYKDFLYKKWKKNNLVENDDRLKSNFKLFEIELKSTIKEAKRMYYFNEFENCRNDMKRTWKSISQIINRNKKNKNFPGNFKSGDNNYYDNKSICDEYIFLPCVWEISVCS